MEIKHLTAEDIEQLKEEHPESEPKEWGLIDEGVYFGFYDTEEEVKAARDEWNVLTMVEESFRDWAHKMAEEVGVEVTKVLEIVRGTYVLEE